MKASSLTVKNGKEVYALTFSDSGTPVFIDVEKVADKIMHVYASELENTTAEYPTVFSKGQFYVLGFEK